MNALLLQYNSIDKKISHMNLSLASYVDFLENRFVINAAIIDLELSPL